jgi:hypothetical protein
VTAPKPVLRIPMTIAPDGMVGRTYLESAIAFYGKRRVFRLPPSPVVVLARWGRGKGVIRNVAVRRTNGEVAIRPFRGLRRCP